MTLTKELDLPPGQKLVHKSSRAKGSMQNIDIDEYDIVDENNLLVGRVTVTEHMSIKAPFATSRKIDRSSV